MIIKRGEVYMAFFGDITKESGSEQRGTRPALIIQNDTGNMFSPTVIVAPVTAHSREAFPTHVDLSDLRGLEIGSKACLEQIRTIDKRHIFGDLISVVDKARMWQIDKAIQISLGLIPLRGGDER